MVWNGRNECSNLREIIIFLVYLPVLVFSQFFGQVKEWAILELHEMKGVLHIVGCPIVFIWFYNREWQGGVLKLTKNEYFLVFLAVWVFFPKSLGRLGSGLC